MLSYSGTSVNQIIPNNCVSIYHFGAMLWFLFFFCFFGGDVIFSWNLARHTALLLLMHFSQGLFYNQEFISTSYCFFPEWVNFFWSCWWSLFYLFSDWFNFSWRITLFLSDQSADRVICFEWPGEIGHSANGWLDFPGGQMRPQSDFNHSYFWRQITDICTVGFHVLNCSLEGFLFKLAIWMLFWSSIDSLLIFLPLLFCLSFFLSFFLFN